MRNKFERKVYNDLCNSFGKENVEYETERLDYVTEHFYTPDFVITTPDGKIYVETKGYLRKEARTVLKAVQLCNPDVDLRIIFQQNNPVYKGGIMRYLDWAEKNNIKARVFGKNTFSNW